MYKHLNSKKYNSTEMTFEKIGLLFKKFSVHLIGYSIKIISPGRSLGYLKVYFYS